MGEYDYLSYRLGLIENQTIRHKRNEMSDLLYKVLLNHNLGGQNKMWCGSEMPTKSPYMDVLSNILYFKENKNGIPFYDVVYYEHLLIFGINHTSKNLYKWLNLVTNLELILNESSNEDCITIQKDLTELHSNLLGLTVENFDTTFYEFYSRVLNSHYSTKGYKLTTYKNIIITSYKGKIICLFPKKDPYRSIRNTIKVVSKFHSFQNKNDDVNSKIDLIYYW